MAECNSRYRSTRPTYWHQRPPELLSHIINMASEKDNSTNLLKGFSKDGNLKTKHKHRHQHQNHLQYQANIHPYIFISRSHIKQVKNSNERVWHLIRCVYQCKVSAPEKLLILLIFIEMWNLVVEMKNVSQKLLYFDSLFW